TKRPNPFGLYDMLGAGGEMVSDFYQKDYYKISPLKDPQGPDTGEFRISRGGAIERRVPPSEVDANSTLGAKLASNRTRMKKPDIGGGSESSVRLVLEFKD
ncbi:MAG: SUMF1/EgtB/PvdO family nonheme iron enzyme, partial [Planctomycetaceae bacterium]|nr:SUMF1/EgtB/PvdO family nonheme iron enzyme [Planctomycetaceae bacterium]